MRDIRQLSGVTDIVDDIGVLPIVRTVADHAVLREKIEIALRREAEAVASRIAITVEDGCVLLRGKVKTWRDREIAETAAWATPGVTAVDDQLTIGEQAKRPVDCRSIARRTTHCPLTGGSGACPREGRRRAMIWVGDSNQAVAKGCAAPMASYWFSA